MTDLFVNAAQREKVSAWPWRSPAARVECQSSVGIVKHLVPLGKLTVSRTDLTQEGRESRLVAGSISVVLVFELGYQITQHTDPFARVSDRWIPGLDDGSGNGFDLERLISP